MGISDQIQVAIGIIAVGSFLVSCWAAWTSSKAAKTATNSAIYPRAREIYKSTRTLMEDIFTNRTPKYETLADFNMAYHEGWLVLPKPIQNYLGEVRDKATRLFELPSFINTAVLAKEPYRHLNDEEGELISWFMHEIGADMKLGEKKIIPLAEKFKDVLSP